MFELGLGKPQPSLVRRASIPDDCSFRRQLGNGTCWPSKKIFIDNMAVNLVKHKDEMLNAWQEVVDEKKATNWALFGYEGQSYDLKLVSKGDGGLTEMAEDLHSSKIMYAFCRVDDPKTSLPKYVLINWQGETAPAVRKGTCANHLTAIEKFFKGVHVTINARTEDEVDPDYVIDRVAKASGSAYSFKRIESREDEAEPGPVGSTYRRVNPSQEIDAKIRDSFWAKEEEEEKKRQLEEQRRKQEDRKRREEEQKQRELEASRMRDQQVATRMRMIAEQRLAEEKASGRTLEEKEKQNWAKQREEDEREDEERRMRSEILRRQRSSEAQALIKQRNIDARAIFEQNTAAGQLSSSSRRSSSSNLSSPSPTPGTKSGIPKWPPTSNSISPVPSITSPTPSNKSIQDISPAISPTPPVKSAAPPPPPPAELKYVEPSEISKASEKFNSVEDSTAMIVPPAPEFADQAPALPKSPPPTENPPLSPAQALLQGRFEEELAPEEFEEQDWESPPLEEGPALTDPNPGTVIGGQGQRARALYDYQAADETEISFDPGDIISHIDQIDPGWWQGVGPDGAFGLFPANYVELISDE